MRILGIATMTDSAACLVEDGRIVAAIEEERLTRVKHDGGLPLRAVAACLDMAGCSFREIDEIAVYWRPWRVGPRLVRTLGLMARYPGRIAGPLGRATEAAAGRRGPRRSGGWGGLFRLRRGLEAAFGPTRAKLVFHDHHDTHLAAACFPERSGEAIAISFDGGGEADSTVIYRAGKGGLRALKRIGWPNSLGHYYSFFTGYLGFGMLEGEYKMMGLAPHGEPRLRGVIRERVLRPDPGTIYSVNHDYVDYHGALRGRFPARAMALFGPPRAADEPLTDHHRDIAASVQAAFADALVDLVRWAKAETGLAGPLVLTGGCALNSSAAGRLLTEGEVERVVVPPAPHDAGCALGAAALSARRHGAAVTGLTGYHGPRFGRNEIAAALTARFLEPGEPLEEPALAACTAEALARGELVAWFQGAMEFGPRALGARSFLADPRDDAIREKINASIKKRELFRPFAPSVLEERAREIFELDQPSPYMNIVAPVRPDWRARVPAIVHVDGSARVHTVSRETNPRYWALIDAFARLTGVPVLLNTSFNIQEPIVCTPAEAVDCFLRSGVEHLAIGDFLVSRGAA